MKPQLAEDKAGTVCASLVQDVLGLPCSSITPPLRTPRNFLPSQVSSYFEMELPDYRRAYIGKHETLYDAASFLNSHD